MCEGTLNSSSQAPVRASSTVQRGGIFSWRVTPGRYFEFRRRSRISSRTSASMLQRRDCSPLPAIVWAGGGARFPAPRAERVGARRQFEYLFAEHRVAGIGDSLAAYRHAIAEALQRAADVVHWERPEA